MIYMEQEIISQPVLLRNSVYKNRKVFSAIKEDLKNHNVKTIIYAARGSSDNAGLYFKYLVEISIGIPVSMAAPSVLTIFSGKINFENTLVVGVSQSGRAEDVCIVLEKAKQQGALTIALTNDTNSPLSKLADHSFDLSVDKEISVAATKTYTAQLVLLSCLVEILKNADTEMLQVLNTISSMENIINDIDNISVTAKQLKQKSNVYVLGRGYVYTIAKELALKMQETSYIQALSYASSDFYHGPIAMIDNESFVIMLMPDDESLEDNLELLERIKGITNKVLILTDKSDFIYQNKIVIPKTKKELSPLLFAVASQLFALKVAVNNGYNPDQPRNLKKVTITR